MTTRLKKNIQEETKTSELAKLLAGDENLLKTPQVGELIKGKIINVSKKEVRLDIEGWGAGIVRGRELYLESPDYSELKLGDKTEATVMELENENGELELSFRFAGHKKVWDNLKELMTSSKIVQADILDANRGGLLVKVNRVAGFLPVSQLSPEHYPRVPGGDKNKILEKLKSYVKQKFNVKIITTEEQEEKLIVSEKAAWEEQQHSTINKYKVDDIVEGKVTAVTDFGAFVKFGENLEGLIHISELAWQRIDDPKGFIKVGEDIKARIINVEGSKIFLSTKALQDDPWKDVEKKYQTGQIVKGRVLKANPFGLFIELDKDIHGLAHISEISNKPVENIAEIAKPNDVLEFKIISIEPKNHRLGLSLKQAKSKKTKESLPEETFAEGEPASGGPVTETAEKTKKKKVKKEKKEKKETTTKKDKEDEVEKKEEKSEENK